MKRRAIIAVILFVVGTAVYLAVSGAPSRVHGVTIASEFCLFAVVTFFLCALSIRALYRIVGAAVSVAVISAGSTWLSSKVIATLNPLEPRYFVMELAGFVIQALLFAGIVWSVALAIEHARNA